MRVVIMGSGALGLATARALLDRNHEVVIIERDAERIDKLSDEVDCGWVHGDGSRPGVLKDVGPSHTDWLLALGDDDQDNILAALVGQELEFGEVLAKVEDREYLAMCEHLGLSQVIVPDDEIGRSLADQLEAGGRATLTTRLKGDLRFFSFTAGPDHVGRAGDLDLPEQAQLVALTRNDASMIAGQDSRIEDGDEVLLILQARHAPAFGDSAPHPVRKRGKRRKTSKNDNGDAEDR